MSSSRATNNNNMPLLRIRPSNCQVEFRVSPSRRRAEETISTITLEHAGDDVSEPIVFKVRQNSSTVQLYALRPKVFVILPRFHALE